MLQHYDKMNNVMSSSLTYYLIQTKKHTLRSTGLGCGKLVIHSNFSFSILFMFRHNPLLLSCINSFVSSGSSRYQKRNKVTESLNKLKEIGVWIHNSRYLTRNFERNYQLCPALFQIYFQLAEVL